MNKECLIGLIDHPGRQVTWLNKFCREISRTAEITKISSIYTDEFEHDVLTDRSAKPLVAAISINYSGTAEELLTEIQRIEGIITEQATRGVINVMLLTFGQETKMNPQLTLPHPRLHKNPQLLYPAAEIAGNYVHPVLGKTLSVLTGELGLKWGRFFDQGSKLIETV